MSVHAEAIANLNDVLAELVCGLASGETPSRGWAFDAVQSIELSQRELGVEPRVTAEQIAEWEGIEE